MAANSKRELIINNMITTLEAVETITVVKRTQLYASDMKEIPANQYPCISVVGLMPKIISMMENKKNYKSSLDIHLFCYALDNETPDSTISSLADDIWKAVLADLSRGSIAITTKILPEMISGIFSPYCAFKLIAQVEYFHTNESI